MDYSHVMFSSLIFVFTVFLFPSMETAVYAISESEPLRPLMLMSPLILLAAVLVFFAYTIVEVIQD